MTIEIRKEQPVDYSATENVTREAFWNQYTPGCNEHYLMHIMRNSSSFIHQLDLVAVDKGVVVGNVVCVKATIQGDNGKIHNVATLGPISVLPEYQNRGVGGKLIEKTQEIAKEMGFPAILLMGDPDYYSKHGFISAEELGIRTSDNIYAVPLQVSILSPEDFKDVKGRYIEGDIYEINTDAAEKFDKKFPHKEKISGTPSQKRFEELVTMFKSAE